MLLIYFQETYQAAEPLVRLMSQFSGDLSCYAAEALFRKISKLLCNLSLEPLVRRLVRLLSHLSGDLSGC